MQAIEVTKEAFFAALAADRRDIMPSVIRSGESEWRTNDSRRDLFGKSKGHGEGSRWWIFSANSDSLKPIK
jgi:hypothetical protein